MMEVERHSGIIVRIGDADVKTDGYLDYVTFTEGQMKFYRDAIMATREFNIIKVFPDRIYFVEKN